METLVDIIVTCKDSNKIYQKSPFLISSLEFNPEYSYLLCLSFMIGQSLLEFSKNNIKSDKIKQCHKHCKYWILTFNF